MHAQFSRDEIRIDTCNESSGGDSVEQLREWLSFSDYRPKTDIGKRIFCNRPLTMKNIVAVGFDMDYTLAQYMPETFESLAYHRTIEKLVYDLKYPSEVCLVDLALILTMFTFVLLFFFSWQWWLKMVLYFYFVY